MKASEQDDIHGEPSRPLRRGWTTGTCAAAAARAAAEALWTSHFPHLVPVLLPGGQRPEFAVAKEEHGEDWASAGIIKDAGDDPDVTHGALIMATVRRGAAGSGVSFRAGEGVGTVTRPGLPLPPGEPAINPVPREMIRHAIQDAAKELGQRIDVVVEISIPGGRELAAKTLNGRLGIVGGLSILGTTGIVIPFSCSAWIHSIHRGIDVAKACGLKHIAGATGTTSEAAVAQLYDLPETALIEMGDFAGGMLKYLRQHPVDRITVAGGFAKMSKLASGLLDLHSSRGAIDLDAIAVWLANLNASAEIIEAARAANTAHQALSIAQSAGLPLADLVAGLALQTVTRTLAGSGIAADVAIFGRSGELLSKTTPRIS